jgi:DNA-binding transcriptional ArsR family regulator
MTVRDTSRDAYYQIRDEGLLSRRRLQVYEALRDAGPCTANELYTFMKNTGQTTTKNQQTNLTPRLGELRDLGVVSEVREKSCDVTGRIVIEWEVNYQALPVKIQKPHKHKCLSCNGKGWSYAPKI